MESLQETAKVLIVSVVLCISLVCILYFVHKDSVATAERQMKLLPVLIQECKEQKLLVRIHNTRVWCEPAKNKDTKDGKD